MEALDSDLAHRLLDFYESKKEEGSAGLKERQLAAGDFLLHQGESSGKVYLLLEGSVKIYHTTLKGSDYLMALVGPGEIFGEVEILSGEPHICSVQALWQARVAVVPKELYLQWFTQDADFAVLVHQVLCSRLQRAGTRAALHMSYPLEYSLLQLFLRLAEERNSQRLTLGKREMADYLGTSVRSINRILKKFHENRLIVLGEAEVQIPSLEQLQSEMGKFEI